jgi:hypothetical protein
MPNRLGLYEKWSHHINQRMPNAMQSPLFWEHIFTNLAHDEIGRLLRENVFNDAQWRQAVAQVRRDDGEQVPPVIRAQLLTMLKDKIEQAIEAYGLQIERLELLSVEPDDVEVVRFEKNESLRAKRQTEEMRAKATALADAQAIAFGSWIKTLEESGVELTQENKEQLFRTVAEQFVVTQYHMMQPEGLAYEFTADRFLRMKLQQQPARGSDGAQPSRLAS